MKNEKSLLKKIYKSLNPGGMIVIYDYDLGTKNEELLKCKHIVDLMVKDNMDINKIMKILDKKLYPITTRYLDQTMSEIGFKRLMIWNPELSKNKNPLKAHYYLYVKSKPSV
jgi:hypothetical protein